MEHAHSGHAHPSVGLYLAVFGALMVLTAITVAVAFVNLGLLNNVVALVIAGVKTTLVVLFFMHVHYASRVTKIFAAAGFFWLAILIIFTVSDMQVRAPAPLTATHGWSAFPSTSPIEPPAGVVPHTASQGEEEAQQQEPAHH
ncbi:MAG TPA: cytochrome C oxidase subunit IV family protein [Methylomirabilota bacterium]|jgi:cytochrome c oxidase subunit 4|nr:cytochrome C oxidase subunit IV family protein [Methylomirabilota bacterium]